MILLGIVIVAVAYAIIAAIVIKLAGRWARRSGRHGGRAEVKAAYVMYVPVLIWLFWDLPAIPLHKYYCATQAGFFVYKTPEQWVKENPDVTAEDLKTFGQKIDTEKMRWSFPYMPFENNPIRRATMVNRRIYLDFDRDTFKFLPIRKTTSYIADAGTDERLAQYVTFGSGYGNPMTSGGVSGFKFWLSSDNCSGLGGGDEEDEVGYTKFLGEIIKLGEKND